MIPGIYVRRKRFEVYREVIQLRKKGFSYGEIKKQTGIAKSTINNWLARAGLTLTAEHLNICIRNSSENHILGTEAAKVTKQKRRETEISKTILRLKENFKDPLFLIGLMLYEAEGSKGSNCSFSNSDYRLIQVFIKFIAKYFNLNKNSDIGYRLAIHQIRKDDLFKILGFWAKKLKISTSEIHITWKRNIVTHRRLNPDYVGQMNVSIHNEPFLSRKLLTISDIILMKYQRIY